LVYDYLILGWSYILREIFNIAMGILLACAILAGGFLFILYATDRYQQFKIAQEETKKANILKEAQLLASQREQARLAEQKRAQEVEQQFRAFLKTHRRAECERNDITWDQLVACKNEESRLRSEFHRQPPGYSPSIQTPRKILASNSPEDAIKRTQDQSQRAKKCAIWRLRINDPSFDSKSVRENIELFCQ
jgi:hypothetical protein